MTNETILKKAIEKAVKNGFDFDGFFAKHKVKKYEIDIFDDIIAIIINPRPHYRYGHKCEKCNYQEKHETGRDFDELGNWNIKETIFSHDWAKAFWGEKEIWCQECTVRARKGIQTNGCESKNYRYPYKEHLQQMVLEKEPLKYIEQFL